jgi:hypothetical protein
MRVLTLRKLISVKFSSVFLCFSVEHPDGLHLRSDSTLLKSGRGWNPHVWTGAVIIVLTVSLYRPEGRDQSAPFGSERPDGDPTEAINSPARRILTIPHSISLLAVYEFSFCEFLAFCIFLSYFRYFSSLFLFSFF